jgi:hypothetical protein
MTFISTCSTLSSFRQSSKNNNNKNQMRYLDDTTINYVKDRVSNYCHKFHVISRDFMPREPHWNLNLEIL